MTVQLRTQTIATQDVLGDNQIKVNSSQSTNTAEPSSTTATLAKTSTPLDSQPSEQSTDSSPAYDDAEEALEFVLPDILIDDKSHDANDVLFDNEQLETTNQETANELQAFMQNPRAQSFKTQPEILPEDLAIEAKQASLENNLAPALNNIMSTSPVENEGEVNAAKLAQPVVTQLNTMTKLHDSEAVPLATTSQPVSTALKESVQVTTSAETTKSLIETDKLLSGNQQRELLVKPTGTSSTVQDQYLATRFLSENSSGNMSVNNISHRSTTTDAINTLASSVVLNDEKDFQKGFTQQVLSSVENREHTLSKPALGATVDSQTVSQQWRKEQLPSNSSEWGQRLLHVLSDKVSLQIGQQIQRAQIRLDPPQLGSIEIAISVEGDKTTVHLVAGNAQIREAMQQTLDQLRQSLSQAGDNMVEVDVGEKQQQSDNSGDTIEIDIAENTVTEDETTLKTTENSTRDWLNRLV